VSNLLNTFYILWRKSVFFLSLRQAQKPLAISASSSRACRSLQGARTMDVKIPGLPTQIGCRQSAWHGGMAWLDLDMWPAANCIILHLPHSFRSLHPSFSHLLPLRNTTTHIGISLSIGSCALKNEDACNCMRGDHALQLHGTACFGAREFRMKGFSFGRSSSYSHMGIEYLFSFDWRKSMKLERFLI
jgi:hypothetical protein